jgi:hypothetical protein
MSASSTISLDCVGILRWRFIWIWICLAPIRAFAVADDPADSTDASAATGTRIEQASPPSDSTTDNEIASDYQEMDLFDAMKQDKVGVLVEPRNFSVLRLSLRNKTQEPLLIRPPEVFAAIPTQRVMMANAGAALGTRNMNAGYGFQSSQGLGGSFYQPTSAHSARDETSLPDDSLAAGGREHRQLPKWLLLPGKIVTAPVPCFCLEFGKPDPNPRIPYLLRPLEDLTKDQAVRNLLIEFSHQKYSQRVMQLAVWHVANQVPWNVLAKSTLPRSIAGRNQKFSKVELAAARTLAESMLANRRR